MTPGRYHDRSVIDVALEDPCPAQQPVDGTPIRHDIQAVRDPNGATTWRCIHCGPSWAELDEQANRHLRRRQK